MFRSLYLYRLDSDMKFAYTEQKCWCKLLSIRSSTWRISSETFHSILGTIDMNIANLAFLIVVLYDYFALPLFS